MIQSALSKAQFNTKKKAVIQSLNLDGTANIKINGVTYNNIKIRTGLLPQVNEVVWIEIPNNNFSDAYIDSAKLASSSEGSISGNVDGGTASAIYSISQNINGGDANG